MNIFLRKVLLLLASVTISTQTGLCEGTIDKASNSVWRRINEKLFQLVEDRALPGISIAVMKGRDTLFAKGYGWADIQHKIPVTSETIFPIASIEKQFIAAEILRLRDSGALSLDDPITRYLGELYTGSDTIRIRDMLYQVSGLQDEEMIEERLSGDSVNSRAIPPKVSEDAKRIWVGNGFDPGHLVGLYNMEPLQFKPGERWAYCNANYDLLCLVIAKLNHASYYDAVSKIVAKAGVKSFYSMWTPPPSQDSFQVAHGYNLDGNSFGAIWEENTGSGWTNPSGLAQWLHALNSGQVISDESYHQMVSPVRLRDGRRWPYGFGVAISTFAGRTKYTHTGHISGFTSVVSYYPEEDISIAVMTNLGYSLIVPVIEQQVARIIFGEPEPVFVNIAVDSVLIRQLTGTFAGGPWWFVISADRHGFVLDLRSPGDGADSHSYFSSQLLYQGSGYFVGAIEPDAIWISIDNSLHQIDEIKASVFGSGIQIQAVRTE